MNIENYKYTQYASKSESNLRDELELLKAIDAYKKGENVDGIDKALVQNLAEWVYNARPGRNLVSDEKVMEKLQTTDYQKAWLMTDLAYYEVGRRWSKNKDLHDLKDLEFIEENMNHGFYLGLEIDRDVLSELTNMVDATNEMFLLKCRSMEVDRERFVQFCQKELHGDIPNKDIIQKINHYNDGAYMDLPLGTRTLGTILLREDAIDIWCSLLINLHYFPIQGSLIYSLKTVEQCLDVWRLLSERNYHRFEVMAYLLREHMIRLMSKEADLLERNAQSDLLSDEDLEFGKQLYALWLDHAPKYAEKMTKLWIDTFGVQEIASWYSNMHARVEGRQRGFIENELKCIELIEMFLTPTITLNHDSVTAADYQTLLYFMKVAMQREEKGDICRELVERLCNLSYNERYIPQLKLEERTFDILRRIYYCLISSDTDGLSMMIKERYPIEGFAVDFDKAYRSCPADSLWLSVLLLKTETTENRDFFWQVVENLYRFANYEKSPVTDYYFMPFYIAEIIAIQIIPDQKDVFEAMMIDRVSNLHFLLRVLTANDGELSEDNKVALKFRCEREWHWEKQLISQQLQEQTDFLDGYVQKVY